MRSIHFLLSAIVFTTIFISCSKKDTTTSAPLPLTYDFSAVETVLNDSVPVAFGGKCYAIIAVNGQVVFSKSYGGYDANTKQLIASCSKWLSGAVVMKMVDEGLFKLSDTVGKYLPKFTLYGKGNITIAELFSHTSGLPGNSDQGYENDQALTLGQSVDSIAKNVSLINAPGTKFYYGGVGMQVAARVCEVVANKTFKTLFSEKIATPCGMMNSDFGNGINILVAGGVRSTPNDYMGFLNMMMNKGMAGSTRVLSEAAINSMEQSQLGSATVAYSPYPLSLLPANGFYGIGNWRDLTGPGDVLIENSSPGAFGSHPWINRGKKVTGFIFTFIPSTGNISTDVPTCLQIRSLVRTIVP